MDDDGEGPRRRSALWLALQKLAQGAGVQRDDLLEGLDAELIELRRRWGLGLKAPESGDTSKLRLMVFDAIIRNLTVHIETLTSPRGKSKRQYRHAVYVSFNALLDKAHAELKDMDLSGRREWLASEAVPEAYRVNARTSRRYLNHAIDQIEKQLIGADYEPVVVDKRQPMTADPTLITQQDPPVTQASPVTDGSPPIMPDNSSTTTKRWPRWRVGAIVTAAVVLFGSAALMIFKPSNDNHGSAPSTAPSSTVTVQPSAVSTADGPVRVDSIAYLRAGGDNSYAFAQDLKLAGADLASLNSFVGNRQGYEKWVLGRGGVTPFDAKIQIAVRGASAQTVVITDLQVVAHCDKPLTGTLLYSPSAGPSGDIGISFNLDEQFPVARDAKSDDAYFSGPTAHTISLAPGETATLLVDALTARQHCDFSLKLIVATGDGRQPGAELIDYNGKPFEVTAIADTDPANSVLKFSDYQAIYAGGVASPSRDGQFSLVDPAKFPGWL